MVWFRRGKKSSGGWLTPEQVTMSEAYWVRRFTTSAGVMRMFEAQTDAFFVNTLEVSQNDDTPWAVCEGCAGLFVVDRAAARQYALTRAPPPGRAAVPIARMALPAARAWERVFGEWPSAVPRP